MPDGVTFQSEAPATPPAGVEVATDDTGAAGHVQLVKLAVPTNSSAAPWGDETTGLPVEVTNDLSITQTLDPHIATGVSAALTTASTNYTAGDQVGGLIELTNMAASTGGHGVLTGASLLFDVSGVLTGPLRLHFFSASVTTPGDNSPWSLSDGDAALEVGSVVLPDPWTASNNARTDLANIGLQYACAATSLYVAVETLFASSGSFFAANDDMHVTARAIRL